MNNILPLLKVQILQTFRFGRSKKEKKKAIPFLTLLLLVVLCQDLAQVKMRNLSSS